MSKLTKPVLLDQAIQSDQIKEAFAKMPLVVEMFQGQTTPISDEKQLQFPSGKLDIIFDELISVREEYDGYHIASELINQFIMTFPEMKDAWAKLSTAQKWLFCEGMHYGVESLIRKHLGLKQI